MKGSQRYQIALAGALVVAFLGVGRAEAGSVFALSSYTPSFTFQDKLGATTMTLAFDGTYYWSSSGGSMSGPRYAQYDSSGAFIATYAPGLDFRSVFTDSSGKVYARQYNDDRIYRQTTTLGVFEESGVVLSGGPLDAQSGVVLDETAMQYLAHGPSGFDGGGIVTRWDMDGTNLGTVSLAGFGSVTGETVYPANRGIAVGQGHWLTYRNQTLSAWDAAGNRVDTATLVGAGTGTSSHFSLSYANNMVFIVDGPGGLWRGYVIPEPVTILGVFAGAAGLAGYLRRRRLA